MTDYWDSVESIAREVIEQNGLDEENWHDSIHENVDSSSYIIYYHDNETVLKETRNEPDNREVASMSRPDGGWKDMRQTAAFLAMEADVWEKCRELVDEYTPTSFKLKKADGTFLKVSDVALEDDDEELSFNDEELSFNDLDEAKEMKENYKTANEGKEVEVVPFNDDEEEIDIEVL